MKSSNTISKPSAGKPALTTDLLLLPDGRILSHNLTPPLADLLSQLSPGDEEMETRARSNRPRPKASTA